MQSSVMSKCKTANSTTTMVFVADPGQSKVIRAALARAKKSTGTRFDTVALEAIAQSYMGMGLVFKNYDQALSYAMKQTHDPLTLAHKVIGCLRELFPELVIQANITTKGTLAV